MESQLIATSDGSVTIYFPQWNESYHSKHGAIQEAYHVFIKNGLEALADTPEISILEIGFGTGLNAFITLLESQKRRQKINYTGIEYFPVPEEIYVQLNYPELLVSQEKHHTFLELHHCEWGRSIELSDLFTLEKQQMKFEDIAFENRFDLIYFDAFGYRVQPELWSAEIFKKMFAALKNGGILTTYAARGVITRNMKEAGFIVKKTAGPIGKREMTVAYKI